jgi:RHH-type rel operon transcriptional repressor/antitoxin RelB
LHKEIETMLSIRLDPEIDKRLEDLAARTGRTKSFYVREAILEHLEDMEDRYLAIERLENPGQRWTLEEVEQELDLES